MSSSSLSLLFERPLVLSDVVDDPVVPLFDVFEAAARDPADAESSRSAADIRRSRAFVRELEDQDVCIRGDCNCHFGLAQSDRKACVFRQYLSSLMSTSSNTIPRRVRDGIKEVLFNDDFCATVCGTAALKRTEGCDRPLDLDENTFVAEYSHLNMREPINFKRKLQAAFVPEFLFSVGVVAPLSVVGKVRSDADGQWVGCAVVPRSVFTFAHLSKLGAHARLLTHSSGVPAQLVAVANDDVARRRLLYTLENAGAPISVDKENVSPPGKRKLEQSIALGVVRDALVYEIKASSLRIMNAASAINLDHRDIFNRRLEIDESADDDDDDSDSDDDDDDDEDDEDDDDDDKGRSVPFKPKDREAIFDDDAVRKKAQGKFASFLGAGESGLVPYDLFGGIFGDDATLTVCFSPIKNTHDSVYCGVDHHLATVVDASASATDGDRADVWQFVVVTKQLDASGGDRLSRRYPGIVPHDADVYRMKTVEEGVMCFMLPPPGRCKLAFQHLRGSNYGKDQYDAFKTSAWKEFLADHRIAFSINTAKDFDTFSCLPFRTLLFHDLVLKIKDRSLTPVYLARLEARVGFAANDLFALIDEARKAYDGNLGEHQTRIKSSSVQTNAVVVTKIKRLYDDWVNAPHDRDYQSDEAMAQNAAFLAMAVGSYERGIMFGAFRDDNKSVMHHDEEIVAKIENIKRAKLTIERGFVNEGRALVEKIQNLMCWRERSCLPLTGPIFDEAHLPAFPALGNSAVLVEMDPEIPDTDVDPEREDVEVPDATDGEEEGHATDSDNGNGSESESEEGGSGASDSEEDVDE